MQGSSKWKVYMQLKQQTNNDFNILYFEFETIVTSSKDITRWNSAKAEQLDTKSER